MDDNEKEFVVATNARLIICYCESVTLLQLYFIAGVVIRYRWRSICDRGKGCIVLFTGWFTDATHWCEQWCVELSTDERSKTTPWWIICLYVRGMFFCWQFLSRHSVAFGVILSLLFVFLFFVCLYGWGYLNAGWCDWREILAQVEQTPGTGTR